MIKTYTPFDLAAMLKRGLLLPALLLAFLSVAYGQTASLEQKTAYAGNNVQVNLDVTGFSNIGAITLKISYDPAVLSFASASNITPLLTGPVNVNALNGVITIAWSSASAATVNGTLCKLNFAYNGGTSALGFLPGSVVSQLSGSNLLIGYTNGSVGQAACIPGMPQASLGSASAGAGSPFSIPVSLSNFPLTGALTLTIQYDATKLSFVSASKGGALASATVAGANGVVDIAWFNTMGANVNTVGSTFLNLNFICNMPGSSDVTFGPGSLASTPTATNINVCFDGGSISQTPTANTAMLGSLNSVTQGQQILVPLYLNIAEPVSSFTLYIEYDQPLLSYGGIDVVDPLAAGVLTYVSGNVMTMVYTNGASPVIAPGTFLNLKFIYHGMGTGHVSFTGSCQFANNAMPLPQPINVAYTNATIAPGPTPPVATVTLGSVAGVVGNMTDIPITIDGANSNPLGAATMFIGYDMAKLAFVGAVGNPYNAIVYASNGQISLAWADPAGVTLNGTFITLRFNYTGGAGSGCGTEVYFRNDQQTLQPCELAKANGSFAPATWINGGVNLSPSLPVVNGPANPNAFSIVNYFTDPGMFNYAWTVTGGSVTSGTGSSSVMITWGAAGPGNVAVTYTTTGGCNLTNAKPVTIVNGSPLTNLEGYVTYDNTTSQGMNGVNITLFNSVGVQTGAPVTTVTNAGHGYYQFAGIPQDDYTMTVSLGAPWAGIAGVTALDALLVELHTAGVLGTPLAGIRLAAANVNNAWPVNATDALLIKQRIIGDITAFPAGDWVFNNGTAHAFSSPVSAYDFKGLCTGDVNGSYDPVVGVKSKGSVEGLRSGLITAQVGTSFTYDLKSTVPASLGAMTLFLEFNPDLIEVEKINTNIAGLEYNVKTGLVSLAWSNPMAKRIDAEGTVLSVQIRLKKSISEPVQPFRILDGSEIASDGAEVLSGFQLKMADILSESGKFAMSNYPNPFRHETSISYSLPATGNVRMVLTNIVGSTVCTLVDEVQTAGAHTYTLKAAACGLTPGIYLCRIEVETGTDNYSKTTKLIYAK